MRCGDRNRAARTDEPMQLAQGAGDHRPTAPATGSHDQVEALIGIARVAQSIADEQPVQEDVDLAAEQFTG